MVRSYLPLLCVHAGRLISFSACNLLAPSFSLTVLLLSGVPDYFGRNKISSGGDLSHYSSASLY